MSREISDQTELSEPQPPSCCECKHFHPPDETARLSQPKCAAIRDIVYGTPMNLDCYTARGDQLLCVRPGRYFSPASPGRHA